jgi:hypothetical protein
MGSACVSNLCSQDVEFDQVNMKISQKNLNTLEKYGQGAAARREVNKIKQQYIKEIADLKTPI